MVNDRKIEIDENGIRTGCELLMKMAGSHECSSDNIKYYYATIINIICRYHRIYSVALNIEDRRWGEYYRFWTHFLEVAVYRFRVLGNVKHAEWINEKVYVKYARKKSSCKPNIKQESRTKLEKFNLKFLQKALTEEDWDTTVEVFKRRDIDVAWMHTAIDFFIYQEMDVILSKFIENPCEKYLSIRERSALELLDRYFELLNKQKLVDEKSDLYGVFYYYLKSIYLDRKWLKYVPKAGNSVFNDSQNPDYDENCLRAQLYYVFFEMIIQWKDENVTLSGMRHNFVPYIMRFAKVLQTQILSLTTTNTVFLVMMLSNALLLIRKNDANIYGDDFELFDRILNVFSEQYRIKTEEYKKLEDMVNNINQRIDEVMDS